MCVCVLCVRDREIKRKLYYITYFRIDYGRWDITNVLPDISNIHCLRTVIIT